MEFLPENQYLQYKEAGTHFPATSGFALFDSCGLARFDSQVALLAYLKSQRNHRARGANIERFLGGFQISLDDGYCCRWFHVYGNIDNVLSRQIYEALDATEDRLAEEAILARFDAREKIQPS